MPNTESDATYCSEAERENLSQRRRSQRISEKLSRGFRSYGNTASQRFDDIYQMLKSDTICDGWSKQDWLALRFEVGSTKKLLKGFARSKITFVEKKINQNLRKLCSTEVNIEPQNGHVPYEPVKSPNILVGMTTEVLSELPPYQPSNMTNLLNTVDKAISSIRVTQVNPMDLTKKDLEVPLEKTFQIKDPSVPNLNEKTTSSKHPPRDSSRNLMIDLTDDNAVPVIYPNPTSSKPPIHTSKWLKYLPTQEQPKTLIEKPKPHSPLKDKPRSFKQSLIKLYKDHPNLKNNIPEKASKSTSSASNLNCGPTSLKSRHRENSNQKAIRNTESVLAQDFALANIQPRNFQSEPVASASPDFLADDLIQLDLAELSGDSMTSLPFSLKESFKKVFGTDSLNDVFGCDKIIYSLSERHVERLAIALNVEQDSLKRIIERILTDDSVVNCALPEDDMQSSGSSVVECSQSPPHRLFPSQRSQISK